MWEGPNQVEFLLLRMRAGSLGSSDFSLQFFCIASGLGFRFMVLYGGCFLGSK
jgi:hypothetical protein